LKTNIIFGHIEKMFFCLGKGGKSQLIGDYQKWMIKKKKNGAIDA